VNTADQPPTLPEAPTDPPTAKEVITARAVHPVRNASQAFVEAARSLSGVEYEVAEDGAVFEQGRYAFGLDIQVRDADTVALELHAHSESSQRLAVEMLCGEASPEEVADVLGEVLNVTAGLVKRRLYEDGHHVRISVPRVRNVSPEEVSTHRFGLAVLRGEIDLALTRGVQRPKPPVTG
jgi:hypothetical protein